jgi:hypothetical protein
MDFHKNVLANFKQYLDNNKNIELQLKKDEYEKHCIIEENKLMFREDNNQKELYFTINWDATSCIPFRIFNFNTRLV